jgi:hypothetical protein
MTLPTDVAHLPATPARDAADARDAPDALPLLTMMLTSRSKPAVHGGLL